MEAPLALYRRYRPETFAEVIGQDHVTGPLRAALNHNRVHHAYLFSGPRGCGKTTSARILARCLNCEKGPTDTPCGICQSCTDLARGGPGSIDVIEIDAASHGGVDDARDLRERAFFAPVNSRYKVYIIDEAHMVTPQGFNALLKLVEEPPEHLKFIFATTEPDKVIGTIRSRTHHYPFRLIAPRTLSDYLRELCDREGVHVDPAALPLVVRAGGGSARDTLSVLDQLIGGAGDDGVGYELATALLGYTPDTLLDEVVDAFAAGDGRTVFGVVDKVIETGQDPRRFTEDLLRRLRDLLVIAAVPDAPATGLIDVAQDQGERLTAQAARFGRAELSRAAELVADGLTELRGATAPRLLLELICARVLLPGADHGTEGVMARLDRIEKRLSIEGTPTAAGPAPAAAAARAAAPTPAAPAARQSSTLAEESSTSEPSRPTAASPRPDDADPDSGPAGPVESPSREPGASAAPPPSSASESAAESAAEPAAAPAAGSAAGSAPASAPASTAGEGSLGLVEVRRLWPDLLEAVKLKRRYTWILLSQNAQVAAVDDKTLTVALVNAGARNSFSSGGSEEILRQAAIDVIGHDWRIEAIVDPSARPGAEPSVTVTRPAAGEPATPPVAPATVPAVGTPADAPVDEMGAAGEPRAATDPAAAPVSPGPGAAAASPREPLDPAAVASARDAIRETRPAGAPRRGGRGADGERTEDSADSAVDRDDPDADDHLGGAELLQRELGASVIEEIRHD